MVRYPDPTRLPVPMTDEQQFFFDLRGWLVLSAVLSDGELEAMRAECYAGVDPLEERPGGVKDGPSAALQTLLDHPAVVGVLSEILSEEPFDLEQCYGIRCEDSHVIMRAATSHVADLLIPFVRARGCGKSEAEITRLYRASSRGSIDSRELGVVAWQSRHQQYPEYFFRGSRRLA